MFECEREETLKREDCGRKVRSETEHHCVIQHVFAGPSLCQALRRVLLTELRGRHPSCR